jgi:hypothetical protein
MSPPSTLATVIVANLEATSGFEVPFRSVEISTAIIVATFGGGEDASDSTRFFLHRDFETFISDEDVEAPHASIPTLRPHFVAPMCCLISKCLDRHSRVATTTSFLTLVTTRASVHRSKASITSDGVFPTWVGPTMSNELLGIRLTCRPYAMPWKIRGPRTGRSLRVT